jgi:hypothetical protein
MFSNRDCGASSLHASSEVHQQARSPLRELDAVLLIGFDVLAFACVTCQRVMMIKLGDVYNLMLTAMIWRTERRTVVAAMVGGNCNMDETLEAVWAEVTIQSKALLPVLRLMALRAMMKHHSTVQRSITYCTVLYVVQSSAASPNDNPRAVKAGFKDSVPWSVALTTPVLNPDMPFEFEARAVQYATFTLRTTYILHGPGLRSCTRNTRQWVVTGGTLTPTYEVHVRGHVRQSTVQCTTDGG